MVTKHHTHVIHALIWSDVLEAIRDMATYCDHPYTAAMYQHQYMAIPENLVAMVIYD